MAEDPVPPAASDDSESTRSDRRRFLAILAGLGASGAVLADRVLAQTQNGPPALPDAAVRGAAEVAGLDFTQAERDTMAADVADHLASFEALRKIHLDNGDAPALVFCPLQPGIGRAVDPEVWAAIPPGNGPAGAAVLHARAAGWAPPESAAKPPRRSSSEPSRRQNGPASRAPAKRPADPEDLAFQPVTVLSELVRTRQVRSMELTELYLGRLKKYDPILSCVITLTEELARRQAAQADSEIGAGRYRGPLHGIPWAAKDLMATRGIPTTWGAAPYRGQVPHMDSTVVEKLDEAGAVLVAKTSVGALAWGDVWFGGMTKNPWKTDQGSSGSSAGSAASVAAGLVGFALGTETLGSIVSPSTRCGATGLRPTFGRVSRYGVMALCWSLDKVGPLARSAEDCALVLDAIRGADGRDPSVVEAPFDWSGAPDWRGLRVGYDRAAFDRPRDEKGFDDAALEAIRKMGVNLIPITLPDLPVSEMLILLDAEAAAAFDELTRTNQDDQLTRQVAAAWPNVFRAARLIPAVEYIQANRIRTLLMKQMDEAMAGVDLYASPTYGGITLRATNMTGHPEISVPSGFRDDGTPVSITFTGRLYGEAKLVRFAGAYQEATGWNRRRPHLG